MGNHTYQVENRRAKLTATIEGKSLKDALKREGLDPEKWTLVVEPEVEAEELEEPSS
ncbi:hypothetical protein ES703_30844 [subsurface metagenome]